MLILTLDDAVKVARRLIRDDVNDAEIIRQELEQKCWFPPKVDEAAKHLNDLIDWCTTIQTEMKMAMVQLPCWGEGERNETD